MEYSIGELSKMTGVSGRTLRYYDEIGILRPSRIGAGNYRFYETRELELLQQILFYRERGFSLEEIKSIVYDPSFDVLQGLLEHLEHLQEQQRRLHGLIATVEETIRDKKGEELMKDAEKFRGLQGRILAENEEMYGQEAREAYGEEAFAMGQQAIGQMPQETFAKFQELEQEILKRLQKAVETEASPEGTEGEAIAKLHEQWITMAWGKAPREAQLGLTEMYLLDARFLAYYDGVVAGCAQFLRDAVVAMRNGKKQ